VKILITSGGTEEPIDGVRYITNFSTGKTGAVLADTLNALGAQVTLLHGHRSLLPENDIETESFTSFTDLNNKLKNHLASAEYDAIIHLAAVSDFSVDYIETESGERLSPMKIGKLSSDENLNIRLKKNFKILNRLKKYNLSGNRIIVIGFKLTDTDSPQEIDTAVKKLLISGDVDFAVHNNLREISSENHPARIFSAAGDIIYKTKTKKEMAESLFSIISGELK